MIRGSRVALMVLIAGTIAGCSRLGLNDAPRPPAQQTYYEPLPAAPTAPVTQNTLQPLPPLPGQPGAPVAGAPVDPNAPPVAGQPPVPPVAAAPGKTQVADAGTAAGGAPVGRTELLGGWRIASGTDNCQLFMNLTSWAGGYRAISKGCTSFELQKISAWDLQGKTVTLKGSDGSTVATLVGAGGEKFTGRTSSSQPITLSR